MDEVVRYVGIVRIKHGNEASVRSALHVVLTAQRMQAGAGSADLTADQGKRDQAACIVGAVHMLGYTHTPEDHGAFGATEGACNCTDGLGVDAAKIGHAFGAVARHMLLKALEVLGIRL